MNITIVTTAKNDEEVARSCSQWDALPDHVKDTQWATLSKIAQAKRLALKPKFKGARTTAAPSAGGAEPS